MTTKLKVTQIGNSLGIVLPKEVLAKLRVDKGDHLTLSETPDGMAITSYDETTQKQLEAAEVVMRKNRNLLHKLAQ